MEWKNTNERKKISPKLGEYLKICRNKKRLSLQEVQQLTGISASYLNRLESGKDISPTLPIIYQLAQFYNISVFDLVAIALDL